MMKVSAVTTIPVLLTHNPKISDRALEGVIEANIVEFNGFISVKSEIHPFATGKLKSRCIYISPFGKFVDYLATVKRSLVGIKYDVLLNNGSHISEYVLGLLDEHTQEYQQAQNEAKQAFAQGRRITIIISNDGSNLSISLDQDKSTCVIL